MGQSMSMDPDQLQKALEKLQSIPHLLNGDRSATPISDLKHCQNITEDLKGFSANSGTAANWISGCCTDLQTYISQLVTQLQSACSTIGGNMDNSIKAYKGGDKDSQSGVTNSGQPVLNGDGRGGS